MMWTVNFLPLFIIAAGATLLPVELPPPDTQYLQYSASETDYTDSPDDNAQEVKTEVPGTASILSVGGSHQFIANSTAQLPCKVSHQGGYKVVWKRGVQVLTAGEQRVVPDSRISVVASSNLQIANVTASDEGEYTCQLAAEHVQEISHRLAVLAEPRITATVPQVNLLVVRQEQTVELECRGRGNPTPYITWNRLNHEMPSNAVVSPGAGLKIFNISRSQGGVYQCKAQNGIGRPDAHNITIKVEYAPEVYADSSVVYAGLRQEAVLGCHIDADPMGNVTWFRNTMKLVGNEDRIMTQQGSRFSLLLRRLERSDFGNYTCLAENALGKTRVHMELSGRPHQPTFTSDPSDTVIHDSYSLSWVVESVAAPTEYCLRLRRLRPLAPEEQRRRNETIQKGLSDEKDMERLDHTGLPEEEEEPPDDDSGAAASTPLPQQLLVAPQPPPPQPGAAAASKQHQQQHQHGDKQHHHHDKHHQLHAKHLHHHGTSNSMMEHYNVQDFRKAEQHHLEHPHKHHRQHRAQRRQRMHKVSAGAGPKLRTVLIVTKEQEVGQWREWSVLAPPVRPPAPPRPGEWYSPPTRNWMHLASFVVTELEHNSRYEAYVAAKNEFGWGPDSERLVFSTAVTEVKERALKKEVGPGGPSSSSSLASPPALCWVTMPAVPVLLALRL